MNVTPKSGWVDRGTHPEDGVMAFSKAWFEHEDSGVELAIWAGVEPGSARYEITSADEYAVEVTDGKKLLDGEGFETEDAAIEKARDVMNSY